MARTAEVKRETKETQITLFLNLDGSGNSEIDTPIPFLSHMLEQISKHGYFDLIIKAQGDTHIDYHHTVEDIGIVFGKAIAEALGDKKGIRRFANASIPLNESMATCVVDISGRAFFVFNADLPKAKIGTFDVELVSEFFQAVASNGGLTLHINISYWTNLHHVVEAIFKSFARALDIASETDLRSSDIPSTKGKL